jgi:hypothetical protein
MPDGNPGTLAPFAAPAPVRARIPRLASAALAVLACAVAGCGGSPEKQLKDTAEHVASWATAAEIAGERWQAGVVPRRYAEAAAEAAQKGIEQQRTRLAKVPKTLADGAVGPSAREMSELSALASRLWTAVRSGDRGQAGELAHELGERGRALRDGSGGR